MENTNPPENKTVAEKIVAVPVQVGATVVKGTETVLHDSEHAVVKVTVAVVDATKVVVADTVRAAEQLGRDLEHVVAPTPVIAKPSNDAVVAPTPV